MPSFIAVENVAIAFRWLGQEETVVAIKIGMGRIGTRIRGAISSVDLVI